MGLQARRRKRLLLTREEINRQGIDAFIWIGAVDHQERLKQSLVFTDAQV